MLQLVSRHHEIDFTKFGRESGWPFVRSSGYIIHAWNYYQTVNAVSSSCVTLKIFFLGLGLTVTEINIKIVQKQDLKNIKNVKRCRDGMPKSMQTR